VHRGHVLGRGWGHLVLVSNPKGWFGGHAGCAGAGHSCVVCDMERCCHRPAGINQVRDHARGTGGNGLLCRWLAKSTELSTSSQTDLDTIGWCIDRRLRRFLNSGDVHRRVDDAVVGLSC